MNYDLTQPALGGGEVPRSGESKSSEAGRNGHRCLLHLQAKGGHLLSSFPISYELRTISCFFSYHLRPTTYHLHYHI